MNRRQFVRIGTSVSVSSMLLPAGIWDLSRFKSKEDIGLQLYTVRDDMAKSPDQTLAKVSAAGYRHVENAGYMNGKFYGMTPVEFKKMLKSHGLKMYSGHVQTGFNMGDKVMGIRHRFQQVCEDSAYVGFKYIGVGWMPPEERKTIDDYKRFAEMLNKAAVTARKFGLTFFHHNHDFEFLAIDGIVPYDILLNETDNDLVKFEVDHYWSKKAGVDSVELIRKNPGRFPLWHIKDMDATPEAFFTEVGTGIINYGELFKHRRTSGNKLFFIEQDTCRSMPPLESIGVSINNLKKLKV